MAIVATILQEVVKRRSLLFERKADYGFRQQKELLKKILGKSKNTEIGKDFSFEKILSSKDFVKQFQSNVPIYEYDSIYKKYWNKLLDGKEDITWPGKVKYFGLTSGTSNASSKKVPVTKDMISAIRKTGFRQLYAVTKYPLPADFFTRSVLMLGGSTDLVKIDKYYEGDLSGILQNKLPMWFNNFYKPGMSIAKMRDWTKKLDLITQQAKDWDIGAICGVPAWVQLLMEKIIHHYNVESIHDIWPNLQVYVHGGVSLEPYKESFQKLLGKKIYYLETYLASEGFLAYQRKPDRFMQLVLDNGIFFEFVPFNSDNFETDGSIKSTAKALLLNEVQENVDYAILITTVAGSWRYLIGDTVRFKSIKDAEFIITGRTKHFISLCGEHLSVDNMNKAVSIVAKELNIHINEYAVAGIPYYGLFAHKWYIGTEKPKEIDVNLLKMRIDDVLKELNDDYRTERSAALKEIMIEVLPTDYFYEWMQIKNKVGGQNKFPRVLNGLLEDWDSFIKSKKSTQC